MKTPRRFFEYLVTFALVALLVLLSNPFMFWMPSTLLMVVLTGVTALVFVWVGFVLTENARDEREEINRTISGRTAYLVAAGMLTIALIYQGLTHTIDLWIPATLAVMILAKLGTREYRDTHG